MALKQNDKGPLVKKWQKFLIEQGFLKKTADAADGDFGPKTLKATKAFQSFHGLKPDGIAGSITFGKAYELGFNPDNEPALKTINTSVQLLAWIKENLGKFMRDAVSGSSFSEDLLAGIAARETGFLIIRYFNQGFGFGDIAQRMKGDYRKSEGRYRGFGFWQIDIGSYPDFITSGKWKSPELTAKKAVSVLEEKKRYLESKGWGRRLGPEEFERAVTAAYNCGQGNVDKALSRGLDVDSYTYSKDYSAEVFRYRKIYRKL